MTSVALMVIHRGLVFGKLGTIGETAPRKRVAQEIGGVGCYSLKVLKLERWEKKTSAPMLGSSCQPQRCSLQG